MKNIESNQILAGMIEKLQLKPEQENEQTIDLTVERPKNFDTLLKDGLSIFTSDLEENQ
ncbi:hypothetical protein N9Y42_05485 [Mariniblastus sp.]|nr:hypothetical protein [Mariniblastus sp.]